MEESSNLEKNIDYEDFKIVKNEDDFEDDEGFDINDDIGAIEFLDCFRRNFEELRDCFLTLQLYFVRRVHGGILEVAKRLKHDFEYGDLTDALIFMYYYIRPCPLYRSDIKLIETMVRDYIDLCGVEYLESQNNPIGEIENA